MVERVIAMRSASGNWYAQNLVGIARVFGIPISLIVGKRDLRLWR